MNVYQIVTERIIEQLEKQNIPWLKPWNTPFAKNFVTKREYNGLNRWLLYGYGKTPYWITYKQAAKLGNVIKREELANYQIVTFWKIGTKRQEDGTDKKTFILLYHKVYNLSQTTLELPKDEKEPIKSACDIVDGWKDKPLIVHKDFSRAFYSPSLDVVNVPELKHFATSEGYHATLFHELAHATGSAKRLDREGIKSVSFGSETYSKEELIAELASAFLCASCGIQKTIENQTAYLKGWLNALKGDSKLIVSASSKAQKACEMILNVQPVATVTE